MRRALAAALLAPALALVPGPAHAQAPDAVGWWSTLHRAAVPVVPPPPPDVAAGDLLLQGGDLQRELPGTAPAPTAYAALRYALPEDGVVTALTLQVAAGAQAADVRAYPTDATWQPEENGAIEDAPVADLSRYAVAALSADGSTLTFPEIGKLTTDDGLLSVVLVPGVGDRVVVHHPTAAALTVQDGGSFPGPVTPVPPPPAGTPVLPVVAPAPGAVLPPVAPAGPQVAVTSAAPLPQVPAAPVTAAVSRRLVGDDSRARWFVAGEALLVLVFFGLLGQGPLRRLAPLTGAAEETGTERGIGRFRAVRDAPAPHL